MSKREALSHDSNIYANSFLQNLHLEIRELPQNSSSFNESHVSFHYEGGEQECYVSNIENKG